MKDNYVAQALAGWIFWRLVIEGIKGVTHYLEYKTEEAEIRKFARDGSKKKGKKHG